MKMVRNTLLLSLITWFAMDTSSHGSSECISDKWDDLTCCITRSGHCCKTENGFYPDVEVNVCLQNSKDEELIEKRCKLDITLFPDLGQWSKWSNLGGCSLTCGQGIQYRTRNRFLSCAQKNETAIEETVCNQTKCPVFKWDHLNERNLTFEEKKELMKHELVEIKANLTVDKKNTSSAIRRRTSAPDHRHSASSFGYVGIILLVLPLVLLVCADCIRCCQPKGKSRKKRICLSKEETGVELTVMELETK